MNHENIIHIQLKFNEIHIDFLYNINLQSFRKSDRYQIFQKTYGDILIEHFTPDAYMFINLSFKESNLKLFNELLYDIIMLFDLHYKYVEQIIEKVMSTTAENNKYDNITHSRTVMNCDFEQKIHHQTIFYKTLLDENYHYNKVIIR